MSEAFIPSGAYGDIAIDAAGLIYLAVESPARDNILVSSGRNGGFTWVETLDGARWDAGQRWALYPRIASSPDGRLAVVYQRGPCLCLSLIDVKDIIWPVKDVPFGVEMAAVAWIGGRWRMAAVIQREGAIRLVTVDYAPDGTEAIRVERPTNTTQGISRIDAAGTVWLVDDDRASEYPNLSRPWRAGRLTVGQANNAPARAIGYIS